MSLFGSGRREGLLAVLILLLLSIALHAPGVFLGQRRVAELPRHSAAVPRSESVTNQTLLLPAMQAAGAVLDAGAWPLWNPHARLGEPFAVSGGPVLYPPFWLLMHQGSAAWLDLLLCLHTFLAACGMYRFCRALPLSRYAAFCAGAMYGLGWVFHAQLDRLPHAAAAALLPLALEFCWRILVHRHRRRWAAGLSAILGLMFCTGGTSVAVLGTLLCIALFAYGIWALDSDGRVLALRAAGLSGLLTLLATAPIWIHHLSHHTVLQPADQHSPSHLQSAGLLGIFAPGLFGGLATAPESVAMANPHADPLELALYPGAVALFLIVLGLLRPKRTAHSLFWVPIGGICLLLAIDTPLQDLLRETCPWAPAVPGVTLILANLAAVVLAAIALENFFEAPLARPRALQLNIVLWGLLALGCLICGFWATSPARDLVARIIDSSDQAEIHQALIQLRSHILPTLAICAGLGLLFAFWRRLGILRFKLCLAGLLVAELLATSFVLTPRSSEPPALSQLQARIPEFHGRAVTVGRADAVSTAPLQNTGAPALSTQGASVLARTRDYLNGIDGSMVQVGTRAQVLPLRSSRSLDDPRLTLVGVGVALAGRPMQAGEFLPLAPTPLVEMASASPLHVLLRKTPAQRLRVMYQEHWAGSPEEAREVLHSLGNEIFETVVLEGEPDTFRGKRPARPAKVRFVRDHPNELIIEADLGQGRGYLVVADAWAPGWTATIDGEPTRLLPAQIGLRAVAVPEGKHLIRMVYRPSSLSLGLPLTLLGLLLIFGLGLRSGWQQWRSSRA